MLIINIIQIVFLVVLGMATLYVFVFAFAGLFYKQAPYPNVTRFRKIAVLIPGYKEDDVITEVAKDALLQDYPVEHFDVVIIADSFNQDTLNKLRALHVKVIEVSFEKSTKAKALNKAMEQLPEDYEIALILDADNLMERSFLGKINALFEKDFQVVQCHRVAKNMNNSMAVLDAASEEINNHIFRKGHRVLGLSSAIIGSGMAFRYSFFKELMSDVTAVGGFDKELELKLLKNRFKIEFLDDAYVYDEKVQQAEVFHNQRRRWLSAQIIHFRKSFSDSLKELLISGNIDYFDKSIQMIQPPRVLLLASVILLTALFVIYNYLTDNILIYNYLWLILFLTCIMVFVFSVPRSFYNATTIKAMASLPGGMWLMFKSLLKIKGANKQFIHTRHTSSGKIK